MTSMSLITIREYGCLTTDPVPVPTLDRVQITSSAFDWLCRFCEQEKDVAILRDRRTLQWLCWCPAYSLRAGAGDTAQDEV